jgi:hypothetical protein
VKGALVVGLLWVLMAPDNRGNFPTAASCETAIAGFRAQARDGARWVEAQYRAAPTAFWSSAVQRAADQVERARNARCVEAKS